MRLYVLFEGMKMILSTSASCLLLSITLVVIFGVRLSLRRKCDSNTSSVVDGKTNAGDIASSFADKYNELYTSVSYNDTEMSSIRSQLTESSVLSETQPVVNCVDVLHACAQLKAGKKDGSSGLVSDHFINACEELSVHTFMLFSTMLVHGFATEDVANPCTLIPIPKGKNVNVTDFGNCRGITLSSVFGKIFDLIFLNKYYDYLCTSERLFGFNVDILLICTQWY